MRRFRQFACVDWSGAKEERPKGLALAYCSAGEEAPVLLQPDGGWSRDALLAWLRAHAEAGTELLVALDLSPALPFADRGAYFPGWAESPPDARGLWALVDALSGDDPHLAATSFLRHRQVSRHFRQRGVLGDCFEGGIGRLRVVERRCREAGQSPATSCFNLVGAAQVGKSSLTGMRVLHRLGGAAPFWPFDPAPAEGPLLVEIYTSVAAKEAGRAWGRAKMRDAGALDDALRALGSKPHRPLPRYDDHAMDAVVTAAWLRRAAEDTSLWSPELLTPALARTEGWTFGVR